MKTFEQFNESRSSDQFYPADHFDISPANVMKFFRKNGVDDSDVVCLSTTNFFDNDQSYLYNIVLDIYYEDEYTPDDVLSERYTGSKVNVEVFTKPFPMAVSHRRERMGELNQIWISKDDAERILHEYRGMIHGEKFGI